MSTAKKPTDHKPSKKAAAKPSTGRTTPRAEPKEVTDSGSWAAEGRIKAKGYPLEVPSGKVCLVKRPDGLKLFLDQGMVPNALLPIVQEAVNEHKEKTPEELQQIVVENPEMLGAILELATNVVLDCVLEPKVHPVPLDDEGNIIPPHQRDEDDTLYIDYIDGDDLMFIFNFAVSGVTDLSGFR